MNAASTAMLEQRLIGKGSPFELLDGEFRNAPRSLTDLYAKCRPSGSQPLVFHAGSGLTGEQVFQRAGVFARTLVTQFGIGAASSVAIVLRNGPEWLIAFVAISSIGATAVVIHRESGEPSITRTISRTGCSLVVTDEEMISVLSRSVTGCPLHEYKNTCSDSSPAAPAFAAVDPESIALIAPTSGSTGEPKQIVVSHRALMHGVMNTMLASALASMRNRTRTSPGGPPVSLLVAPLSHVSGYSHFLTMLRVGGTVVTTPFADAGSVAELIEQKSVSSLVGAQPNVIRDLIREPGLTRKLGSLRSLGVQGASLSAELLSEIVTALPEVTVASGYGLTETSGLIALASGAELMARPRSCGRVIPSVETRVVDGEIWIRGRMLASDCTDGEWFRTGDSGLIDKDGFLYVTGRADGSLTNLEDLALEAGCIDEATAVDLPALQGEARTVVAVVRKPGCGLDLEGLALRVRLRAGAAVHVIELPKLPRTPTGKVDRAGLRGTLSSLKAFS